MRLELYLVAAAVIGMSLFRVHSYFNEKYSGDHYYQQKITQLQSEIDRADLAKRLAEKQKFDYQQSIAMKLPSMLETDAYNSRNIASVINTNNSSIALLYLDESVEKAKAHFNAGQFEGVVKLLKPIYLNHADHPVAPEATFLLMEAYHFLGKREESSMIIENMLRLYPESYLTGYALLRLASYFQQEGDESRASYVYQLTKEKFSFDPQIVKSANEGLRHFDDDSNL